MRLAHPGPAAVVLVAGSALFTAVSGVSFAAAASTAAAVASAAAPPGKQSCEPLQLPAAPPSPSATPTTTSPSTTPTPTSTTPAQTATPTPTTPGPSTSTTAAPDPTSTSTHPAASPSTTPSTTQASLCVEVTAAQASSERGKQVRWTVNAWTTGATAAAATVKLQATPAARGTPTFSFGCGKSDGTSSCDLGAVDPLSAHRQLQVQLTVPVTASAVKSVSLTATGTATALAKAAKAAAAVAITAPRTSATTQPQPTAPAPPPPPAPSLALAPPMTVTSPLPAGSLPGIPSVGPAPAQSPAGNAAGLFPTVNPSPGLGFPSVGGASRVADTSALPESASVVNAQLAGLAALALAFVLAVTRLSLRHSANQAASQTGPGTDTDGQPGEKPAADDAPGA